MVAIESALFGLITTDEFRAFRQSVLDLFCERFTALPSDAKRQFSPPTEDSIRVAWSLSCRIPRTTFPACRLQPSPEGGVALCFSKNARYADFECFNSGEVFAATSDRRGDIQVFKVDFESPHYAIDHIGRFLNIPDNAVSLPRSGS